MVRRLEGVLVSGCVCFNVLNWGGVVVAAPLPPSISVDVSVWGCLRVSFGVLWVFLGFLVSRLLLNSY